MGRNITKHTSSHNFGILIPEDTGVTFEHQTGGVMCHQQQLEGIFLPLSSPTVYLGRPEWATNITKPYGVPLSYLDVSERDYESFPEAVKKRGYFLTHNEYLNWERSRDVWWAGPLNLLSELKKFNYDPTGSMPHSDRDMSETWDGAQEIWEAIDSNLGFEYEQVADYRNGGSSVVPDGYPGTKEGIRWIRVEGSKTDDYGRKRAEWADGLSGEIVALLYPNSD